MAEVKAQGIEQGLRDTLNVGLGLFNTVAAKVEQLQKDVLKGYQELVTRGAQDKSEVAQNLRTGLGQGITSVKDARSKIEGIVAGQKAAISAKLPK